MKYQKHIAWLLSGATALILWQIAAAWIDYPQLFPSVAGLTTTVVELFLQSSFYQAVTTTVIRGCLGFLLACIFALPIGFLCGKNRFWYHYFNPLLSALRSTPIIAFILLLILWLPTELIAPTISFITMFPIICENISKGVQSIDPAYEQLVFVFRCSAMTKVRHIYWPALHSYVESGTITAFGFGWKAVIMGEVLAHPFAGVGIEMKQAQTFINVPSLIAWTVVAIAISFLLTELLRLLLHQGERRHRFRHGQARHKNKHSISTDIEALHISKKFPEHIVFEDFSVKFPAASRTLVRGVSGKGKTTLLNLLSGLTTPNQGTITGIPQQIGYVFQSPALLPWLTANENILLVAGKETHIGDLTGLMKDLEIENLGDRHPHELSGGECQRIAIARALAAEPQLLLLDEPFSGLDKELANKVARLISTWQQQHDTTIVCAMHENSVLLSHDKEVIL